MGSLKTAQMGLTMATIDDNVSMFSQQKRTCWRNLGVLSVYGSDT
jgi:hypothetical protein